MLVVLSRTQRCPVGLPWVDVPLKESLSLLNLLLEVSALRLSGRVHGGRFLGSAMMHLVNVKRSIQLAKSLPTYPRCLCLFFNQPVPPVYSSEVVVGPEGRPGASSSRSWGILLSEVSALRLGC